MAIIDLRNLVDPEYDVIKLIGSIDKKEYEIPLKKTMGMSLMMTQYFSDYTKSKNPDEPDFITNLELNYRMITSWIRGYYPEISVEWVKSNVSDQLLLALVKALEPLFFPKLTETAKPKRPRKKRKS